MADHHRLMGGKLHVYRRENSTHWQCSVYLDGKNWRETTKEDSLALAKEFAEDWYLGLRGKLRTGDLKGGKTFTQAAEKFLAEYRIINAGERSPQYIRGMDDQIRVHLMPFFGPKNLSEITSGLVQEYRMHRATSRLDKKTGEPRPPAKSTLRQEIITLRHVLKTAERHNWLRSLPDISSPYKTSGKVSHRAWFSHDEYKQLYTETRRRASNPRDKRWKQVNERFHDYVLFMANTGLRPDEAARLEFRDVAIVTDEATGERILEIEVRGKRGVGYCKSTNGAVRPFERLRTRAHPKPTERLFGRTPRTMLNRILNKLDLKFDRDGSPRTAYSLRHTYICFRLMEGADIYQIAKNCRTSVEMIEKFYARHIKNTLDAAAINVRKAKPGKVTKASKSSKAKGKGGR